ncbi:hypothetical protein ACFQY5_15830 [Paeniroseomonas aquatica]|uniref:Phasin domain-containing protein n=1 Tax=Paeniroseomonas aquatica TaxID=373043 RepID=A0ABT8A4R3_9PROT|nr:hypothetical protein [Paeniroseomonas aquatica]MDN3564773.1 hypothetical protein [Paeniroseomonas aquatica]
MDQILMSNLMPSLTAATDVLASANRNSSQTGELALAAAEVVLRRMTLGGIAMVNPAGADHAEFARMVPEKTRAFADAGTALASQSARMGEAMARFLVEESAFMAKAAGSVMASGHAGGMMAAQAQATMAWFGRMAVQSGAMCLLALEAQGAALAPIHRAATGNATRLRA